MAISLLRMTARRGVSSDVLSAIGGACLGAAVVAMRDGPSWPVVFGALFGGSLGVVTRADICARRIPNRVTYAGTVGALLVAGLSGMVELRSAGFGALLGGGLMGLLFVMGRGKLGFGDVKLSVYIGAVVGATGVPLFLVIGTGLGAVAAAALLLAGRPRSGTLAYGPFLVAGAFGALALQGLAVSR